MVEVFRGAPKTLQNDSRNKPGYEGFHRCSEALYREYDAGDVEAAVELAVESNLSDLAGVKQLLTGLNPASSHEPLKGWSQISPPDLTVYAVLGGGS